MVASLPTAMRPAPVEGRMDVTGVPSPWAVKLFTTLIRARNPTMSSTDVHHAFVANANALAQCRDTADISRLADAVRHMVHRSLRTRSTAPPVPNNPQVDFRIESRPFAH